MHAVVYGGFSIHASQACIREWFTVVSKTALTMRVSFRCNIRRAFNVLRGDNDHCY